MRQEGGLTSTSSCFILFPNSLEHLPLTHPLKQNAFIERIVKPGHKNGPPLSTFFFQIFLIITYSQCTGKAVLDTIGINRFICTSAMDKARKLLEKNSRVHWSHFFHSCVVLVYQYLVPRKNAVLCRFASFTGNHHSIWVLNIRDALKQIKNIEISYGVKISMSVKKYTETYI